MTPPIKTRLYAGSARALSAPNRYRKFIPTLRSGAASPGLTLWSAGPLAEALRLQKQEWPDSAHRALGLEPDFFSNLTDVVLLWDGSDPLEEEQAPLHD